MRLNQSSHHFAVPKLRQPYPFCLFRDGGLYILSILISTASLTTASASVQGAGQRIIIGGLKEGGFGRPGKDFLHQTKNVFRLLSSVELSAWVMQNVSTGVHVLFSQSCGSTALRLWFLRKQIRVLHKIPAVQSKDFEIKCICQIQTSRCRIARRSTWEPCWKRVP